MKKIVMPILVFIMGISMIGCSSVKKNTTAPKVVFNEHLILDQSTAYVNEMVKGNFDLLTKSFSKTLSSKTTSGDIKNDWNKATTNIGNYAGIYSNIAKITGNTGISTTWLKYDNGGVNVSITYNNNMQVEAISITEGPLPAKLISNDKFSEVSIEIGGDDSDNGQLSGILTMPNNITSHQVVILIGDYNETDMDETIGAKSNQPFRDIAEGLAQNGIPSIRYNKRFYQYPSQMNNQITIYDDVLNDVSQAIKFAKTDPRTSAQKVVIVGHGLGGSLMPKIVIDEGINLKGAVAMGSSPRQIDDAQQTENAYMADNSSPIFGKGTPYWDSLSSMNIKQICQELVPKPILIMQGGADFQVSPDIDYNDWKTYLSGRANTTFLSYDNLNHLFMPTTGKRDSTDYDTKSNVDSSVINDLSNWVNGLG